MRISEILLAETTQENEELSNFSRMVVAYIKRAYTDPDQDFEIRFDQVPGYNMFKTPGMQLLTKFVSLEITDMDSGEYFNAKSSGAYDYNTLTVKVDKEYYHNNFGPDIVNVISHEAQHAMDDLKTRKGPAQRFGAVFSKSYPQGKTDAEVFLNYLKQNPEVNARYAEAINDLKIQLDDWKQANAALNRAEFQQLLNWAFNKNLMDDAFPQGRDDPRYKRLWSRAYQYAIKYYPAQLGNITKQ